MIKKLSLVSSLMMLALGASASTTQTFLTIDGKTTAHAASGDTVQAKLQFTNTGSSAVQSVWVDIPGSGFPGYCADITPDQNATGPHTATFGVDTTGTSEGTWDVRTTVFDSGVTSGANDSCDTTIGSNSGHTFFSKLTITDQQSTGSNSNNTGSGSGSSVGGSTMPSWMQQFMASILAILHPTTPAVDPLCAAYVSASAGAYPGSHSALGLQTFLFNHQLLASPYLTSYYGPITQGAVSAFLAAHPTCH